MKEASNEWVFVGDFSVSKTIYREQGIEKLNLGGRYDIQIVLELEGGDPEKFDVVFSLLDKADIPVERQTETFWVADRQQSLRAHG